jgi:hypothetical protein
LTAAGHLTQGFATPLIAGRDNGRFIDRTLA